MDQEITRKQAAMKKEIGPENFVFLLVFVGFFGIFASQMGLINTMNTLMNTAYALLMETVLYLLAICVIAGAISSLFSEFGVVSLMNRVLTPLMMPVYHLPGAASLGIVTTFFSDNPAILSLAEDGYFKTLFRKYQFPALTNLGTSFGMGLIVCTYMMSLSAVSGESYTLAVGIGFLGAVAGSVVSTRIMLCFTRKVFGESEPMISGGKCRQANEKMRPIRSGGVCGRFMEAVLEGGANGVKMGMDVIPGVLVICTVVMMLTNGPSPDGTYTGAAYEGIPLFPYLAEKSGPVLKLLFDFSSSEAISIPVTALGSAGASISLIPQLLSEGLVQAKDIAVFTAMCMCWSGYLSTHVSMMDSLHFNQLISRAIISHTIGGICAGVFANWIYTLISLAIV